MKGRNPFGRKGRTDKKKRYRPCLKKHSRMSITAKEVKRKRRNLESKQKRMTKGEGRFLGKNLDCQSG